MQYRVLFADRSPIIQALAEDILQREGFEVKTATNSETVIEELSSFKPHIIIMDISLHGLDGYRLCKEIKEKTAAQTIPVILLAGAYDPYDEEYAKLVKADDYILKPFESLELIGKIRKLLDFDYSAAYEPPSYSDDAFSNQPADTVVIADSGGEAQSSGGEIAIIENIQKGSAGMVESVEIKEEKIFVHPEAVRHDQNNRTELSRQIEHDELKYLVTKTLDELIAHQFKTAVSEELSSSLKEQIRTALYKIAPEVIEEILREKINIVITSLMDEIQTEIKNALPGIVEIIIRRKFEKIN